ncbi:unnamed protein product [Adineta steineri]|uniref:Guanylate-binding protein N-terminal domain-containing protein n=1 Tax=Adineta steineri TaxID=433720 RepID=A0A814LD93_9BILA|nr:unnamed protein product [Adineta steineri]CAF1160266.1 unnamed protein product [Adineta steineri]
MAEPINDEEKEEGCIELIRCVSTTEEERKDPQYVPKLEINERAQEIISERFQSPISIVALVGKVGVGKSKLASLMVETLHRIPFDPPLRPFLSGRSSTRVTQGIWMWSEPLSHLDENQQGSILVLDCEGMGEADEQTGKNLYLFCMLMSTAFAVVLRTGRVDRFLYEDLYYALHRFKAMRSSYVLPNLWLIAMDTPTFCHTDPKQGDVEISKEQWLKNIFTNTSSTLSQHENQSIQSRYDFITEFLPKLMQNESSREFYISLKLAIQQLLSNGGKKISAGQNSLFIPPAELTALMSDLIDVLNENKMPNADTLINRYLLTHFENEIVNEQIALFEQELLEYAQNILGDAINQRKMPETPGTIIISDDQMKNERDRITRKYFSSMIRLARHQIYDLDNELADDYLDNSQLENALFELPKVVQEQFKIIKIQMDGYHEPEFIIRQIRENSVIKSLIQQQAEQKRLLGEIERKIENKRDLVLREKRIYNSLKYPKPVRYRLAPCRKCERQGGTSNGVHWKKSYLSKRTGNYYHYNRQDEKMVCDACRQIQTTGDQTVQCNQCGTLRKVIRIYKYAE